MFSIFEMARYFGVKPIVIHDWLKQGKFIDCNAVSQICLETLWESRSGKVYPVQEIIDEWDKENSVKEELDKTTFYKNQISLFVEKYNGTYEYTLGMKHPKFLTAEEESDKSVWNHFLRQLSEEER